MRISHAGTLLAALGLTACIGLTAHVGPDVRPEARRGDVRKAAEAFGSNLRWGRVAEAALFVHPEERSAFLVRQRELQESVRFTGFEVAGVELGPERSQASAIVTFKLYRLPSLEEETFVEQQRWQYERRHARWYLHPDLERLLGDGSPGKGR